MGVAKLPPVASDDARRAGCDRAENDANWPALRVPSAVPMLGRRAGVHANLAPVRGADEAQRDRVKLSAHRVACPRIDAGRAQALAAVRRRQLQDAASGLRFPFAADESL